MSLEHVEPAGHTQRAVQELQNLNISLVSGAAASTKINIAAIRSIDTIASAIYRTTVAGALVDDTANVTISDINAKGTLDLNTVIEGTIAIVNGVTYTFTPTPGVSYASVDLGANDDEAAANLAAAINGVEGSPGQPNAFYAMAAADVVTIRARDEGVAGNAITIVGDTEITASGGTLSGGSATGGVESTTDTSAGQLTVFWFNKG